MGNTNTPDPGAVLKTISGGKTIGQVQDHILTTAQSGYNHVLALASWYVVYVVIAGLLVVIAGAIANSSTMKRWGMGAIVVPLIAYAFMFLVPMIVQHEPSWVLPK